MLVALLGVDGHWLFDESVRSGFQRTNRDLRVGARRRADVDDIELLGL